MVDLFSGNRFVGDDEGTRIVESCADALFHEDLVALGVGWAGKFPQVVAAFCSEWRHGQEMRLLDANGPAVRIWVVFSDEQIAEPEARQLPLKARVLVSGPKVQCITQALLQPVVLVVADALVL